MAATTDEIKTPEKPSIRAELWAMAGVAGLALLCMGLLAGALALILGKGSRIQVNSVIGGGAVYAPPTTPVPALASAAPDEGDQPLTGPPAAAVGGAWVARAEPSASTLPGSAATASDQPLVATGQGGWIARAQASAPQAPPPYAGVAYVPPVLAGSSAGTSVPFEIRGDIAGLAGGNQILPMPVRHGHVYAHRPVFARSAAPASAAATVTVRAVPVPVREDMNAPALPERSALEAEAPAPTPAPMAAAVPVAAEVPMAVAVPNARASAAPAAPAPAGSYAGAPAQGSQAELSLLGARSTASLPGYNASPGNLFFTARVSVRNLGSAPLAVGGDAFDLDDADGASYMAMPAPVAAPLAAGKQARRTLIFLVPKDAVLSTLSLVLPSETDPITLSKP